MSENGEGGRSGGRFPRAKSAPGEVKAMSPGMQAAREALFGPQRALTAQEAAAFLSSVALARAAAEARRAPAPQGEPAE